MYVVCVCMYVVICKIDHCIHIHWCIVMGLGHNDPWVESHMWPQQTWGQRSSWGQWPLVQVFGKKGQCIHILWCIFKSIKYYNDCKSMWSRKQARLVVREPPCCTRQWFYLKGTLEWYTILYEYCLPDVYLSSAKNNAIHLWAIIKYPQIAIRPNWAQSGLPASHITAEMPTFLI